MTDVTKSKLPLALVSERFGEDIGSHLRSIAILQQELLIDKTFMKPGNVDTMSPTKTTKRWSFTGFNDANANLIVFLEN